MRGERPGHRRLSAPGRAFEQVAAVVGDAGLVVAGAAGQEQAQVGHQAVHLAWGQGDAVGAASVDVADSVPAAPRCQQVHLGAGAAASARLGQVGQPAGRCVAARDVGARDDQLLGQHVPPGVAAVGAVGHRSVAAAAAGPPPQQRGRHLHGVAVQADRVRDGPAVDEGQGRVVGAAAALVGGGQGPAVRVGDAAQQVGEDVAVQAVVGRDGDRVDRRLRQPVPPLAARLVEGQAGRGGGEGRVDLPGAGSAAAASAGGSAAGVGHADGS